MKRTVRSNWSHALLICGKCSKKLQGGFGPNGDQKLAKALKRRLGTGKGRKGRLGILETGCFDVCPKRAVVLVDSRHPDLWRVVEQGADVDGPAYELTSTSI